MLESTGSQTKTNGQGQMQRWQASEQANGT